MSENINCKKMSERNMAFKVLKIIGMVILGIAVCILLGFVIMWLWNWLMPQIFGLGVISYWQAVGIFVLAKILFGGIGSGGSKEHSKDSPKSEFKKEFRKEFDKEFDKDYAKKHGNEPENSENSNESYDEMYEKWWSQKGEKDFNAYMNGNEDFE